MSHKQRKVLWPVLLVGVVLLSALAFVAGRPRRPGAPEEKRPSAPVKIKSAQAKAEKRKSPAPRNLSLQPEAFNMGRRLGQRFSPGKREKSVLIGTLTIGSEQRAVQTTRAQTDDGEQVEIIIAGSQSALTWDRGQGALSSSSRATGSDRELIERLVLDSPDQFVLAQLRGASYYTVAYNVRPAGAGEKYAGPLWNIVRVSDPEPDEAKRPQSRWRLYYLNVATGLIDKIQSEVGGRRIVATISGWTEVNGEKIPTQITWTSQGQTLMHYSLANFSHGEK